MFVVARSTLKNVCNCNDSKKRTKRKQWSEKSMLAAVEVVKIRVQPHFELLKSTVCQGPHFTIGFLVRVLGFW